jgi:histidinol-phosphate aminotransferase
MAWPDFDALARPGIRALRPYDPGHDIVALRRRFGDDGILELGSNENAQGPSPRALAAYGVAAGSLQRYPDPLGGELKQAIAGTLGLAPAQLLLGNGSHELLMMLAQAFAGPGADVLASEFGFAVYGLAAQAAAAGFQRVPALPLSDPMPRGHDLEALARAIAASTRLVYLANPNNPTGTWFPTAMLERFLAAVPPEVLVVVDEAYQEYVTVPALPSAIALLERYGNLVVTRTFSKAYGLAGLRVGYACAHPGLLQVLERIRESFNVNAAGLAASVAALSDQAHLQLVRSENAGERDWLAGQLAARGLAVSPSQTNFLLVDFGREAAPIEHALVGLGVVLRPMAGYGLPDCLRITLGRRDQNRRLLAALDQVRA